MRTFGLGWDEVLHGRSAANLVLLAAALPSYDGGRNDAGHEVLRANERKNSRRVREVVESWV